MCAFVVCVGHMCVCVVLYGCVVCVGHMCVCVLYCMVVLYVVYVRRAN